jgi:hypothetical protein
MLKSSSLSPSSSRSVKLFTIGLQRNITASLYNLRMIYIEVI